MTALFDQFLLTVNTWMSGAQLAGDPGTPALVSFLALAGAFLWGLVSVLFSPCHLASIPLMVGYVAGQGRLVQGREAARYAVAFTFGLFTTIALVGVACTLLGRMMGDVGPYWTVGLGVVLLWVALDMLGLVKCSLTGGLLSRFTLRGLPGALALGLGYGLLSGSCTFGFLAPLLAVAAVQGRALDGALLILAFALGHCLPIILAGSSAALARSLAERFAGGNAPVRRAAGVLVGGLGAYFIIRPFLAP
ncbi:MAG: sulfite exporter TauE/SafE family protein [Proteobacteria bacterium]|nr:sulfite exporter TauE/SafE family protein [Pseudomonadota bacterium]MBU1596291.1 sulfite exporter TauE/SafE family protein [Pseudomonadota bacterium]